MVDMLAHINILFDLKLGNYWIRKVGNYVWI